MQENSQSLKVAVITYGALRQSESEPDAWRFQGVRFLKQKNYS